MSFQFLKCGLINFSTPWSSDIKSNDPAIKYISKYGTSGPPIWYRYKTGNYISCNYYYNIYRTNLTKPWTFSWMMATSYSLHSVPFSCTSLLMSDNKSLQTFRYIAPCLQSLYNTSNVKSRSMRMKLSEKFVLTPASSTKYTNGLFMALKWMPFDLIFANLWT